MNESFASSPLHPDWRVKYDPDGKPYYENAKTGATSWARPANSTSGGNGQSPSSPQQSTQQQHQAYQSSQTFSSSSSGGGGGEGTASIRSTIWTSLKQEFKKGLMEGMAATTPGVARGEPQRPTFSFFDFTSQVYINGTPMGKVALLRLKIIGYQPPPNQYWYDKVCGAWGIKAGPCLGILPAGMDLGDDLQADASSPTTTAVFINGRRIHTLDWFRLASMSIVGFPGYYWLDAAGQCGIQGNPQPFGMLVLQSIALNTYPGAEAFLRRDLDAKSLLLLRMELENAMAAESGAPGAGSSAGQFAAGFASAQPSPPRSPNGPEWQVINEFLKNLNLSGEYRPNPGSAGLETEKESWGWQTEESRRRDYEEARIEREREIQARKEEQERILREEQLERLRREQQERFQREQQERVQREQQERFRREQQEREERAHREQAARRQRAEAAARAEASRNRARWERYIHAWEMLKSRTAPSDTSRDPSSAIPWPTDAGTLGSCQDPPKAEVERFFRCGIVPPSDALDGPSVELLAILRVERIRWHPDRMRRAFLGWPDLDDGVLRAVTAVSQLVNRLYDDEQAKSV